MIKNLHDPGHFCTYSTFLEICTGPGCLNAPKLGCSLLLSPFLVSMVMLLSHVHVLPHNQYFNLISKWPLISGRTIGPWRRNPKPRNLSKMTTKVSSYNESCPKPRNPGYRGFGLPCIQVLPLTKGRCMQEKCAWKACRNPDTPGFVVSGNYRYRTKLSSSLCSGFLVSGFVVKVLSFAHWFRAPK